MPTKSKPRRTSNRVSAAKRKRTRKAPLLTFPVGTFAKPVEMPREVMGSIAVPNAVFDRLPSDLPTGEVSPRQLADAMRPRVRLTRGGAEIDRGAPASEMRNGRPPAGVELSECAGYVVTDGEVVAHAMHAPFRDTRTWLQRVWDFVRGRS